MTSYQQSIEAATKWKEAVKKLWRTRLLIFIFLLVAVVSSTAMFAVILDTPSGGDMASVAILSVVAGIATLCAYVMQWVFVFDLRRWEKSAPASFSIYVRVLMICTIITLAFGIISYLLKSDELIGFVSIISFAVGVVQFIMFIKLKNAVEMPSEAKCGLRRIVAAYIIGVVGVIVGVIVMLSAIGNFMISNADKSYMRMFADDDYYEDYYDYYDRYDNDAYYLEGSPSILNGLPVNISEEELKEMIDDFLNNESVISLIYLGCIICAVAYILYVILLYGGWYLISKSEIPVMLEPVETQYLEE